ncbi:MAG: DNA-binding domain-containing protein [Halioglobus sp.]
MQLHNWQADVQESILSSSAEHSSRVLAAIKPGAMRPETVDREVRLDVYINAYGLRLAEALQSNYPAVHQLLGDDDFQILAYRYLKAHPPVHASIRWFGESLSAFLKHEAPYASVPAMGELAEFEWALRHTIDAADAEILTPAYLQALNPELWGDLTFKLHPALTILRFNWNTPHIWRALENGETPPTPVCQAASWIVYRKPDLVSGWRSAAAPEIAALEMLHRGLSFADVCENLCELTDDVDAVPLIAATFLRDWLSQGLLSLRDKL